MAFHFRLETLLRYRRRLEEREWLKVEALAQQLAKVRGDIESLRQRAHGERLALMQEMRDGVSASELHFANECLLASKQMEMLLQEKLLALTAEFEANKATFLVARRDREAIESLRKEQYEAYMHEQARREQSEADQMYLLRRKVLGDNFA